ncbi:DVU_1551 family NTP transferase [Acetobacterium sp.]|uniref:DVU_1551 family NTP transferase n=1 Tax=Acetobacterium sp. TaxID=1872094 RepID=UPI00359432AB
MKKKRFSVIIIAAGYSSRMEGFKPLLKFGNQTAVERVVSTYQQAGVDQIILVLGHRADEMIPYFENESVKMVINEKFDQGMYTSIVKGITQFDQENDAFFIHPVDIPLVKPITVIQLKEAANQASNGIIYPCFLAERGHPPLIDKKYQKPILENTMNGGLKKLLSLYEEDALDLQLTDETILMDMDTRSDYEALLDYHDLRAPNLSECYAIWDKYQLPETIQKHCEIVKRTAMEYAEQLKKNGIELDLSALRAAALLHDIAKTGKNHAQVGGELLRALGYKKVGDIIADHMDIVVEQGKAVTENEILYLADKLVKNDQLIDLKTRKNQTLDCYPNNPEATEKIEKRYQNAEAIMQKIKRIIG